MNAEVKTPWNPSKRAIKRVKNPLNRPECCPRCNSTQVVIVENKEIYGSNYGEWPWAYLCKGCRSYVGMHPFTDIPLGTLADTQLRRARTAAKSLFNMIWNRGDKDRSEAYQWLATEMNIPVGECHFGWFESDQCEQAEAICIAYLSNR